ncbi:hypothetical protein, partial [Legionella moravica]
MAKKRSCPRRRATIQKTKLMLKSQWGLFFARLKLSFNSLKHFISPSLYMTNNLSCPRRRATIQNTKLMLKSQWELFFARLKLSFNSLIHS